MRDKPETICRPSRSIDVLGITIWGLVFSEAGRSKRYVGAYHIDHQSDMFHLIASNTPTSLEV